MSRWPELTEEHGRRTLERATRYHVQRYFATTGDANAETERLTRLVTPELFENGTRRDRDAIRIRLRALGPDLWPLALLQCYKRATRADARRSCVFLAIFQARNSKTARELGILALDDRAYPVRWRAHQVLAYSLDRIAIPALKDALSREKRPDLRHSLEAAIITIESQNQNIYKDPEKRGNVTWSAQPWEGNDPAVSRAFLRIKIRDEIEGWRKTV